MDAREDEEPLSGKASDDEELINGARRAADGRFMRPGNRPSYRTDGWEQLSPKVFVERARVISIRLTRAAKGDYADPLEALTQIRHIRRLTDHLEYEAVALARGCMWSWRDVADVLGISGSAAQKRFTRLRAERRRRHPPGHPPAPHPPA